MARNFIEGMDGQSAPTASRVQKKSPSSFSRVGGVIAPVQNYSPPAYVAPSYYAPPAQQTYAAPAQQSYAPPSTPAPIAEPIKPKIDYGSKEYLSGAKDSELDSTFHDQKSMYSAKLKRYIADYDAQTGGKAWGKNVKDFDLGQLGGSMGIDFNNAQDGIARNQDQGLTGLSEDFAARGMINSGLYLDDHGKSKQQYERQGVNLGQGVRNQLQTLNFNRGNQETDHTAQIASARRDALNRLSQAQSLT